MPYRWKNEQKKARDDAEIKQSCTFRPKIIEMDPKICEPNPELQKAMMSHEQRKDRCAELFKLSKEQRREARRSSESRKAEGKKLEKEAKARRPAVKVRTNTKAIDSSVSRMIKARKDKETLMMMKERGFTYAGERNEIRTPPGEIRQGLSRLSDP